MKLSELIDITEFNIPVIEFYNTNDELEYCVDLNEVDFQDIDVVSIDDIPQFGIVKLKRKNDKESELNGKVL